MQRPERGCRSPACARAWISSRANRSGLLETPRVEILGGRCWSLNRNMLPIEAITQRIYDLVVAEFWNTTAEFTLIAQCRSAMSKAKCRVLWSIRAMTRRTPMWRRLIWRGG